MDNSITTASINTSKSTTTQIFEPTANQATFDIGDVVLCPSLSSFPFALTADPYCRHDDLTLTFDGSYFRYDENGYFVCADEGETNDYQPSIYHNAPANQQAINVLYGNAFSAQSSQRQVIDTTSVDDEEVLLINSCSLSNNAGDLHGAIDVLDDMSSLLGLIYDNKIDEADTRSLARITQTTVDTWSEILNSQLERLNEVLALTKFGKVGA